MTVENAQPVGAQSSWAIEEELLAFSGRKP